MKFRITLIPSIVLLLLAFVGVRAAASSQWTDEFNDGVIDTNKWIIGGWGASSSVEETGGYAVFTSRGELITRESLPQVSISGEFEMVGSTLDFFAVSTRRNLTSNLQGVSCVFLSGDGNEGDQFGGNVYVVTYDELNQRHQLGQVWADIPNNKAIRFKVVDDGLKITIYVNDLDHPVLTVTADAAIGDQVSFYNRELGSSFVAKLNWVEIGNSVTDPQVVPGDKVEWPVVSGGNGHSYQPFLAPNGISWEDANAMATALGGHLATVTNAAENDFIYGLVSTEDAYWFIDGWGNGLGPWLGGLQAEGTPEPAGGWGWVTGEPFEYTAWYPGEPNDYYEGVNENRIHLFGYRTLKGNWWNDTADVLGPNSPYMNGFIVEWPPQPPCVLPDGIVSWWRTEGDGMDSVGVNHGILRNGAGFATGKVGQALLLNGQNQFSEIQNSDSLNPTGSFSIEGWVYPTKEQNGTILGKWGDLGDYTDNRSYLLSIYPNRTLHFAMSDEVNQRNLAFQVLDAPESITLNAWNHVAAVYDQTTGARRLFLNGVMMSERIDPPTTVHPGIAKVGVGVHFPTSTMTREPFAGLIDELSFYQSALATNEIAAIYEAGSAGKCAPEKPQVVPGDKVEWQVVSGGNGHSYQPFLAPNGISWEDANAMAAALGGHLATVTNAAENEFIYSLVSTEDAYWFIDGWGNGLGPWLGGFQAEGAPEPAGGWEWVTGEPFEYTAWYPSEPNDYYEGVNENRIHLFGYRTLKGNWWNDTADVLGPNSPYMNGFIVEWPPENTQPVADASTTLPLFISPDNTNATVVLDGTRSFDPDGDPLSYEWFNLAGRAPQLIATGVVSVISMPLGTYSIDLTVSDGMASDTDSIIVEVITMSSAVERLVEAVTGSGAGNNQALIATLRAALASIDRSNPTAAINQLRAFQNQVQAQVASVDPELATEFIEQAQDIIDALTEGGLDSKGPKMVAKHVNGQMKLEFSGNDQRIYVIEASSNMVDWETVGVATRVDDGQFEFNDSSVTEHSVRYYRVVEP